MSKSFHRHAKKFDDDFEYEDADVGNAKKSERFIRQLKRVFKEEKDHDS